MKKILVFLTRNLSLVAVFSVIMIAAGVNILTSDVIRSSVGGPVALDALLLLISGGCLHFVKEICEGVLARTQGHFNEVSNQATEDEKTIACWCFGSAVIYAILGVMGYAVLT